MEKRLRDRRKELRLTQAELAEKINVSPQVISNWERRYTTPSSDDVKALAEALNCAADYLIGKTDNPELPEPKRDEEEFEAFINDPELESWYRELPENDEEDLRQLKEMWEVIKKHKK